jgi:hypothetical protein
LLSASVIAESGIPHLHIAQALPGMLVYGMIFGFIFHLYQWALRGVHLPFHRR